MAKVNVHIYPNQFTNETRILRITKSLAENNVFDSIMVIASLKDNNLAEHEEIDKRRQVWRIPTFTANWGGTVSKALFMLEFSIRAIIYLCKKDVACVNAHSLSTLHLAVIVKLIKRCRLIYDAHEIETEQGYSFLRKVSSKVVEKKLIAFADLINLTSYGHKDWYEKTYKLNNVWVTPNYPYHRSRIADSKSSILRDKFSIAKNELVFIYQGALEKPRGVELIMKVFARLPVNKHIVFMVFGSELPLLLNYVKQHSNIHYLPAVPPNQVYLYTSSADVGIHMMDDSCINHLHALPNKPMEYMNAGIPAIVTDLPEMGRLIRESGAGWIIPVGDAEYLENLILSLDSNEILLKAQKAIEWANEHCWEKEEKTLLKMYAGLGFLHN